MANVQLFRHSIPKFAEKHKVNKRQTWAMNVDKVHKVRCVAACKVLWALWGRFDREESYPCTNSTTFVIVKQ